MKKNTLMLLIGVVGVCVVLAIVLMTRQTDTPQAPSVPEDSQSVQLPNPIVSCVSLEAMQTAVGFTAKTPTLLPEGYGATAYNAIGGKLAEVRYTNASESITYRAATGTDDVSGDYTEYADVREVDSDGTKITLKGDGKVVSLAVFSDGEVSYSLSFSDGMPEADVLKIAASID